MNSIGTRVRIRSAITLAPCSTSFVSRFGALFRICHTRQSLMLENLALRQQLTVLKRRHPKPRLGPFDKLFWLAATRFWSKWKDALFLVSPETVVR
jgi:putative transposase